MLVEHLQFSIPITIDIKAPIDTVWDALTDPLSYPGVLRSVASAKWIEDYRRSSVGNINSSSYSTPLSDKSGGDNESTPRKRITKGSKWKFTRISVLEGQTYSAVATITRYDEEDFHRCLVMSTHEMLGATCSLKLIVQDSRRGQQPSNRDDIKNSVPVPTDDTSYDQPSSKTESQLSSLTPLNSLPAHSDLPTQSNTTTVKSLTSSITPSGDSSRTDATNATNSTNSSNISSNTTNKTNASSSDSCQVTAIMSMIPYRLFVKLFGVMCCVCLLKYRARMAMECDLEDLAHFCEGQVAQEGEEEGDGRKERKESKERKY